MTDYRRRVMGCWIGKSIGGTLGQPIEGVEGPLDLNYYEPVPQGMIPNDDLDMQVVWACWLDQLDKPTINRHVLGEAMHQCVRFPWDETGVALRNMDEGLMPPHTGTHDNWFINGMGAAIRSELWACLAPGDPHRAAAWAYEDACIDHDGEGIWAEVFLAALESLAFVRSDRDGMIDCALMHLPAHSSVRRAINDTRLWWHEQRDWHAVRRTILHHYGHENFTDVTMNLAFTMLGWLAGEDDFGRSICIAVGCGMDTDCTGATLGALLGIMQPDAIEPRWLQPIGRDLVLNPGARAIDPPATLDGLTDMVLRLRDRIDDTIEPPAETQPIAWPGIEVLRGFTTWLAIDAPGVTGMPQLDDMQPVHLPGYMATLERDAFIDETMILRYVFELPAEQRVRVMFNTPQNCRVWLNGTLAFGRECGRMCPSFHRAPINQYADYDLDAGRHTLTAAVRRPINGKAIWVVGVADAATHLWLPNIFVRP
jgi:ADP-ribosylglycohydrolase